MTESDQSPAPTKRPLTLRRTLVVFAISAAVAGAIAVLVFLAIYFPSRAHDLEEHDEFAGLGGLFLGAIVGTVAGCAAAVVTVAVGLRHRKGAGVFTGIFAAVLLLTVILWAADLLRSSFSDPSPHTIWIVAVPLLWAIPAVATRVLWLRWFAVVLGSALVLWLLANGALTFKSQQDQQAIYDGYTGPIFAPSTSPDSPLSGYRLEEVYLPGEYFQYIVLDYGHLINERPDPSEISGYRLRFSAGTDDLACGADCPVVANALGSQVLGSQEVGFFVAIDGGVIALYGSLDQEEALAVFNDLSPSTMSKLGDLQVDPAFAGN